MAAGGGRGGAVAGGAAAFPLLLGLSPLVFVALVVAAALIAALAYRPVGQRRGRLVTSGLLGALAVALAIQVVPYGWARSNPPVTAEPAWDSPQPP